MVIDVPYFSLVCLWLEIAVPAVRDNGPLCPGCYQLRSERRYYNASLALERPDGDAGQG